MMNNFNEFSTFALLKNFKKLISNFNAQYKTMEF